MGTRHLRMLIVIASGLLFACSESDTQGLDAAPGTDARIDAPVTTLDAATDAPAVSTDAAPPDAVPPIDALIADAFAVGDAGQTASKVYSFTLGLEDLAQSFVTPGASLTWNPSDGDPVGSLEFSAVQTTEEQGTVKGQTPFFNWESWGVPAGAQVVYVGVKSYKRRLAAAVNMDHYWAFQIVGDLGESVHYGKDGGPYLEIASLTNVPQPAWETVTGLPLFEVKPTYRASDTRLHVKVWWFPIRSGAIDWRLDELELEILYIIP